MSTDEILAELKTQRGAQQRIFDAAGAEIKRLDAGIAALNGGSRQTAGPSVADMLEMCAKGLVTRHGPALAMTNKNFLQEARDSFPTNFPKIKAGLYNGLATLVRKCVIKKCPGGYSLNA